MTCQLRGVPSATDNSKVIESFLGRFATSLEESTFVKLTLSNAAADGALAGRIIARCINIRGRPHLSLTLRKATNDETKNLPLDEAADWLKSQLGCYRSALLATTQGDWQLSIPADKPARLISHKPSQTTAPARSHDQAKHDVLDATAQDWLKGLEILDAEGRVRARMADKYRQINRYLELFTHLAKDCGWVDGREALPRVRGSTTEGAGGQPGGRPYQEILTIADMGCGKGYLTFGAWHLLKRHWQRSVRVIGVEARPELVRLTHKLAGDIGATGLEFLEGTIESVSLPKLDGLIALHACNTATDAAILRGIELGAKLIVVAPCCHQELRPQLKHPEPMDGILRHGIMEERMAEWLTDGLRALHLEWAGYRTKIIEFVSTEHTPKNLMIAAVKVGDAFIDMSAKEKIEQIKSQFGIEHQALDRLLICRPSPKPPT